MGSACNDGWESARKDTSFEVGFKSGQCGCTVPGDREAVSFTGDGLRKGTDLSLHLSTQILPASVSSFRFLKIPTKEQTTEKSSQPTDIPVNCHAHWGREGGDT